MIPTINYSNIDISRMNDENERNKIKEKFVELQHRFIDSFDPICSSPVSDDAARYMRGFMYELEFAESKRLNRFIGKIQEMSISWCGRCFPFCQNLKDVVVFSVIEEMLNNHTVHKIGCGMADEHRVFSLHVPSLLSDDPENPCVPSEQMMAVYEMALTTDVFDNVYQYEIIPVTVQWIHKKSILNKAITKENFMAYALPESDDEIMLYVGDLIRAVHAALSTLSLSVIKGKVHKKQNISRLQGRIERLQSELDESKQKTKDIADELKKERKKSEDLQKQLKASDHGAIAQMKSDHAEEKQELMTALRKITERHDDLLGKYNDLKSRYQILEDEIEYSGEDEVGLDETKLTRESRFLFVCDEAPSASFQRTYDTIMAAFPNSKMVHGIPSNANGYDYAVLLVKYMFHHSSYYAVRNWCKAHRIPCLHCDKQGVELVIDDVVNRRGYAQTGG